MGKLQAEHLQRLHFDALWQSHPRWLVITGAGCSTEAGIPCYRDASGAWQHPAPVQYQEFLHQPERRQRYWARSAVGWPRFDQAQPTSMHRALAAAEQAGRIELLVTQNVDRLHQRAGSRQVLDLHGRLDRVLCLDCARYEPRDEVQPRLLASNPQLTQIQPRLAPDGDAALDGLELASIAIPVCVWCGGMLKPDVVFYGESLPAERHARALEALTRCDAVLVVGSSLMVYSAFRLIREAVRRELPVVAFNRGQTRADAMLSLKVDATCASVAGWLTV